MVNYLKWSIISNGRKYKVTNILKAAEYLRWSANNLQWLITYNGQ